MQALWQPGLASYQGSEYTLKECHFNPKPIQSPHPPIFFGGESEPALKRVASHGQGWYGYDMDPVTLAARLTRLDDLLAAEGRSRSDIEVYVGPNKHPVNTDTVAAYAAAGVQQLNVGVGGRDLDGFKRRAEKMAAICGL